MFNQNSSNKMGNCDFKSDPEFKISKYHISKLKLIQAIGKGGFGRVWKVKHKSFNAFYALKIMLKPQIIYCKSVHSVMNERNLLEKLKHPFLVNMHAAYQDRENLYLVLDYFPGGDLRFIISNYKVFSEVQTKFIIVCILISLEYLHSNNIIHRDIKPENLIFDSLGYIHLTDFGVARVQANDNKGGASGTPGYMAPEVVFKQNHTTVSDYFALGVIVYEIMLGNRPYFGKSRKEYRDSIVAKQAEIKVNEIPSGWSFGAADFANRLLRRKPEKRLGCKGISEIKNHPWLKNTEWDKVLMLEEKAPFIPRLENNFDVNSAYSGWDSSCEKINIDHSQYKDMFKGYYYDVQESEAVQNTTDIVRGKNKV